MSSIYAAGVRATALSNILTEIDANIITQSDGSLALDVQAMLDWATAQLYQMVTDAEATSTTYIGSLLAEVRTAIQACADVIAAGHWSSRSDWPLHTSTASAQQSASVAGVAAQQAKLKSVAAAASAFYSDTPALMAQTIDDYFQSNVAPDIGAGVTLLEDNRAYIVTYVTDRGEESAPSPASELIECDQNDTVAITVPDAPSGRHVTHFRPYRSNTTNTSSAFQLVPNPDDEAGWPIGTLTITDDKKAAELEDPCVTLLWDEPPADFRGLVGDSNGGMAGFSGNDFCPCVPYIPYAYPAALKKTTEWPIVGLACVGTTYFAGTRGRPYLFSGTDTQSLSGDKLDHDQPCVSKRGIVAMRGGFVYPSPNGLCFCTTTGDLRVISDTEGFNLFDRDRWQALAPTSIVAVEYQGAYLFDWNNGVTSGSYMLDVITGKLVTTTVTASAFYRDSITGLPYAASGTTISSLFSSATKRTAQWKTPIVALDDYPSFSWLQVQSEYEGGGTVTVSIYGDGNLIQTKAVTSREPVRVVQGNFREWQVLLESACGVTSVKLAGTTEELRVL